MQTIKQEIQAFFTTEQFQCDDCKHIFYGKNVGLKPKLKNMAILTMGALEYKDHYFACPKCNKIAFFGFTQVS
jgi:hypothetical protein